MRPETRKRQLGPTLDPPTHAQSSVLGMGTSTSLCEVNVYLCVRKYPGMQSTASLEVPLDPRDI